MHADETATDAAERGEVPKKRVTARGEVVGHRQEGQPKRRTVRLTEAEGEEKRATARLAMSLGRRYEGEKVPNREDRIR